jgi:predicted Fe-Mo cluster-binding NifX family protein
MVRIAIALNQDEEIQNEHFGEAKSYKIFDIKSNAIIPETDIPNPFYNNEEIGHGMKNKGQKISELLLNQKVEAVVSRQYGKNINVLNQYFIPIKAKNKTLNETLSDLRGLVNEIENNVRQINKELIKL